MWYNLRCMTTRTRSLLLLFSLLGLAFSAASAWVHHELITDPSYTSFCDVNATFNCTQVYLSQYGSFQGVSTAVLGLIWFTLAVLLVVFGGRSADPGRADTDRSKAAASPVGAYLFAWSTIGLAVVLYLSYASFFVLKAACLLCIGTYVSVIAIFLLSGSASSVSMSEVPGRLAGDLKALTKNPAMLTVAILFLAGVGSVLAFFPKDTRPKTAEEAQAQANQAVPPPADQQQAWLIEWNKAKREETGVPADGAKVVIVKFNDFQCPSCREGFVWFKPIIAEYEKTQPGAVKFVIKDFPLEGECNFSTPTMNHYASCEASAARRLAGEVGKADEMEKWLFDNQAKLGGTDVVANGYKEVTGNTDFTARYPKMLEGIRQDVSDGVALRIDSTPTYFVNGVRLKGNLRPEFFKLAIETELKKAGGQ
jgi:uncharacterized membrane protein/protein-disulfide isomerase